MKNYERSEIIPMTEEQKKAFELQIKKLDRRIEIMDKIKETALGIICTPLGIFSKIILMLSLISIRVTAIGMFYGVYKSYKVYVDLKNGIPFFESQNLGIAILFLLLPFIMGIISYVLSLLTDFLKFHSF
jgi:hypothetical protein